MKELVYEQLVCVRECVPIGLEKASLPSGED